MLSIQDHVRAEEQLGLDLIQYAGRWVAVEDHKVVADNENLEHLVAGLNGQGDTAKIFRVREDPAAPACYWSGPAQECGTSPDGP